MIKKLSLKKKKSEVFRTNHCYFGYGENVIRNAY